MPFITKDRLATLLMAGTRMSNICFNLSQDKSIPYQHRGSMKDSQTEWEHARHDLLPVKKAKTKR